MVLLFDPSSESFSHIPKSDPMPPTTFPMQSKVRLSAPPNSMQFPEWFVIDVFNCITSPELATAILELQSEQDEHSVVAAVENPARMASIMHAGSMARNFMIDILCAVVEKAAYPKHFNPGSKSIS